MSDNETNLINAVRELIKIVEQEMGFMDWSTEVIENRVSRYVSLLDKIEGSKDDNSKC